MGLKHDTGHIHGHSLLEISQLNSDKLEAMGIRRGQNGFSAHSPQVEYGITEMSHRVIAEFTQGSETQQGATCGLGIFCIGTS